MRSMRKPLPGLDPIESESLSQTFGNHKTAAADSVKIDNFDSANYDPVSPDFDSEFVRWAQLDFESVSNTEPNKIPETKNGAVDQTLNPEVVPKHSANLMRVCQLNSTILFLMKLHRKKAHSTLPSSLAKSDSNGERSDTNQKDENSVALLTTQKKTRTIDSAATLTCRFRIQQRILGYFAYTRSFTKSSIYRWCAC